jgi:hypothetical protein
LTDNIWLVKPSVIYYTMTYEGVWTLMADRTGAAISTQGSGCDGEQNEKIEVDLMVNNGESKETALAVFPGEPRKGRFCEAQGEGKE